MTRWYAAPLLGAAAVLCFAPTGWWWLQPLLLAALAFSLDAQPTPRAAFRLGAGYGAGLFGVGVFWLWNSLYTIGGAPLPVAVLVLAALVAIMAAYHGLALWLALRLAPVAGAWRWFLVLPAAFVLVEWLRGWLFSGFPWFSLGHAQVDSPLAALAPVIGVHGLSAVVLLSAMLLRAAWAWRREPRPLAQLGAAALLGSVLVWAAGQRAWTEPSGAPLRVALVQSNIAQDIKWDRDQVLPTLLKYRELTLPLTDVDLVVWPEASLPILWHQIPPAYLEELTGPGRPPLVMGILRHDLERDEYFNAVAATTPTPQFYAKRRLVPFAEVFPVPDWVRGWLKLMDLPYSDFSRGAADQPPLQVAGTALGASVCFEDAFPDAMMAALPAAKLLVNVSNDAWFGDSIGPHQHFQIARLRALEAGRPLLRATSTGITAVVDAEGRTLARLPQFEAAVLRASVQPREGLTPYARWRDWPVVLLAAAALLLASHRMRSTTR